MLLCLLRHCHISAVVLFNSLVLINRSLSHYFFHTHTHHSYRTLFATLDSRPERPAHALFVSDPQTEHADGGGRVAVVCVRGTQSVHDVVTDVRTTPVPFPPPQRDIDAASRGDPVGAMLRSIGCFIMPLSKLPSLRSPNAT